MDTSRYLSSPAQRIVQRVKAQRAAVRAMPFTDRAELAQKVLLRIQVACLVTLTLAAGRGAFTSGQMTWGTAVPTFAVLGALTWGLFAIGRLARRVEGPDLSLASVDKFLRDLASRTASAVTSGSMLHAAAKRTLAFAVAVVLFKAAFDGPDSAMASASAPAITALFLSMMFAVAMRRAFGAASRLGFI